MTYQKQAGRTFRQFNIIKRLYALEALGSARLAEDYNVSARTILRDMAHINSVIQLKKSHGKWSLDSQVTSQISEKLSQSLVNSFAQNIDIDVSHFIKSNLNHERISFSTEYKKLPKKLGGEIIDALEKEIQCTFNYEKNDGTTQREVDPIKLYTENSRWYLIARDHKDDTVKSFNLSKMRSFKPLDIPATLTQKMLEEAETMQSIWTSHIQEVQTVKLYVKASIAHYIAEIPLHKSQTIHDRHYDGGIETHYTITHKLEILPAIKSWIPYVHILEPTWLREDLVRDLEDYREENLKMDI